MKDENQKPATGFQESDRHGVGSQRQDDDLYCLYVL
jgi:hypothetical protein